MKFSRTVIPFLCMMLLTNTSIIFATDVRMDPNGSTTEIMELQETVSENAPVTPYPNEAAVFRYLRLEMGLNTAASSGIMANLEEESHFEPNLYYYNDYGGTSNYGIAQWNSGYNGGRQALLRSWCSQNGLDYRTLDGQLRFMRHELETVPAYQYSALRAVPDTAEGASQAALLFAKHYEGVIASRYGPRQALAAYTYFPHYISADLEAPVIETVQVERNMKGYLVSIKASDNKGISRIQLAVWTDHNGQDDLPADWSTSSACRAVSSGNGWYQYQVSRADHNQELGLYQTHIYVYDNAGNSTAIPLSPVDVIEIHDYSGRQEVIKEATCDESGILRVYCVEECGHYEDREIPALGHDYTDWTVIESILSPDTEARSCRRCKCREEREIPDFIVLRRLYNPNSGEHFYTDEEQEAEFLIQAGWNDEGTAWNAPYKTGKPVYRLYNPNAGDHHYTMSERERSVLIESGWNDEGIGWNSADETGVPVYRQYNPNARTGSHNFTLNEKEHNALVNMGWHDEGTAWYAVSGN